MTLDEALEVLGGLVARAGGEGDAALDTVKDHLGRLQREVDYLVTGDDDGENGR